MQPYILSAAHSLHPQKTKVRVKLWLGLLRMRRMSSYTQDKLEYKDPVKLDPRILERKSIFGVSTTAAACPQDNLVIEYGLSGFHISKSQI